MAKPSPQATTVPSSAGSPLPGAPRHVAVYFPQSYNFAGQVLIVSDGQVERLDAASSDVMAFIVSGGVTQLPGVKAKPD